MRCICTNSAGLEAEHGYKVKLKVLTSLNFLTTPSFSVTTLSCEPPLPAVFTILPRASTYIVASIKSNYFSFIATKYIALRHLEVA